MKALIGLALATLWGGSAPQLAEPFSSLKNDYNLSFDAAEEQLVFARSGSGFQKARIFVARKVDGRWTAPEPIAFSDQQYSDTDPWLTPDGRTLYFISNRPTPSNPGKKDLDIWRASRTETGWSAPEHLGGLVNSPGPELGVELHGDRLYFASVRKGGRGGLDIYSAKLTAGGFERPQLLEGPFNSAESDSDFTLSPDGRSAAFWRGGSEGRIFIAQRDGEGWADPTPLPDGINHGPFNFTPAFNRTGTRLWFASTRPRDGQAQGMADIYSVALTGS